MGNTKEGKATIIGNAGEYLVVGELLKRGIIAAPAPRNNPGFDVLATNGVKSLNIRIKTKTEQANSWVWMCKKDGSIFKNIQSNSDFTVLVDLKNELTPPEYYVLLTSKLDEKIREGYENWVKSPPKRGHKSHDQNNRMRRIGTDEQERNWLLKWKGSWNIISNALK